MGHHGWPSFRPEEIVSENVIIHEGGRMESRCLTHLGHNLPDGGVDRYCIDLVCMAGEPLSVHDERAKILTSCTNLHLPTMSSTSPRTPRLLRILVGNIPSFQRVWLLA